MQLGCPTIVEHCKTNSHIYDFQRHKNCFTTSGGLGMPTPVLQQLCTQWTTHSSLYEGKHRKLINATFLARLCQSHTCVDTFQGFTSAGKIFTPLCVVSKGIFTSVQRGFLCRKPLHLDARGAEICTVKLHGYHIFVTVTG